VLFRSAKIFIEGIDGQMNQEASFASYLST